MLIQKINSIIFHSGNFQLFEEKKLTLSCDIISTLINKYINTGTIQWFEEK